MHPDTIVLTTAHASSSYGVPVLLVYGDAYGPADMTPAGITGAELVRAAAALFCQPECLPELVRDMPAALTDLDAADGAEILKGLNKLPLQDRSLILDMLDRLLSDM